MLAIDRSISAQRMTKVSPTAMMPVTDTWVRMLPTLSSVAKEGLAAAKKPLRQIRVKNGAMLRIWERRKAAILCGCFRSAVVTDTLSPDAISSSLCRFQQAVLADRFAREFTHHSAALQHNDAICERQNGLGLGREHDDGKPARAQIADDVDDVVLGTDVHAARRLAQHEQTWRIAQPFGKRHFLLVAAREQAEVELDGRRPDLQLLHLTRGEGPFVRRLEEQGGNTVQDADRDVFVDRLLVE